MKILFIANARWKEGLSGSDNIYLMFMKYWDLDYGDWRAWEMMEIDYKPFFICYAHRIILSVWRALRCKEEYDVVYSASDFMMDSFPALIMKFRGKAKKWVAGFYMVAPRENRIYFFTQKLTKWIIKVFADIAILTNTSLYYVFPDKKKTWINGGIDTSLTEIRKGKKKFDCVFCGRMHKTKGIDELVEIWDFVRRDRPDSTLAIIGDGDLGKEYLKERMQKLYGSLEGITFFGHLGASRYEVFKMSKIVLYPTPVEYDHFSMAPVDGMACGCPMVSFILPCLKFMDVGGVFESMNVPDYAHNILFLLKNKRYKHYREEAREFALKFDEREEAERVFKFLQENI